MMDTSTSHLACMYALYLQVNIQLDLLSPSAKASLDDKMHDSTEKSKVLYSMYTCVNVLTSYF